MSKQPKFLILADGDFTPMTSKTANAVIRYRPERVVGVVDRQQAGMTVQEVLGFGGATPVLASMQEGLARGFDVLLIGIAPQGGRLPEEWRAWILEAIEAGKEVWSGLHTFLNDDPDCAAAATRKGVSAPWIAALPPTWNSSTRRSARLVRIFSCFAEPVAVVNPSSTTMPSAASSYMLLMAGNRFSGETSGKRRAN